jgi:hypothetical protein
MTRAAIIARDCAVALALVLALAHGARAADAEPIALELQFEDTAPCFASAELADAVARRSAQTVVTDARDAALSIRVRVRAAAGGGFEVTIESRERGVAEAGMRELQVAGGCEALAAPLSLVIALMVGTASTEAPQASGEPVADATPVAPAPVAAPVTAPAPPPAAPDPAPVRPPVRATIAPPGPRQSSRDAGEGTRWTLSLAGGADLGLAPGPTPVLGVAGRFEFAAPTASDEGTRGALEIAVEYLSSPEFEQDGWKASVDGAGLHGSPCAIWQRGWFGVELCVGLWLRSLRVSGEGEAATLFEPSRATIAGWSTRAALRAQLGGPWSVFAGLQALAPFGIYRLSLVPRSEAAEQQLEPPFFNTSSIMNPTESAPSESVRLDLYDVPVFAPVVFAGVTFTL